MDAREQSTAQRKGFDPAAVVYPAIATSLLAIVLSIAVPLYFPWHGGYEQQSHAAGNCLIVLLGVCAIGVLGLIFSIVGVATARPGRSISRVGAAVVALVAIMILIGSVVQLGLYTVMFAFIGG